MKVFVSTNLLRIPGEEGLELTPIFLFQVKKDVSLTSYVPQIRRELACLQFRVKAMLIRHNCSQAFWLGVLKNRNLEGHVIAEQVNNSMHHQIIAEQVNH